MWCDLAVGPAASGLPKQSHSGPGPLEASPLSNGLCSSTVNIQPSDSTSQLKICLLLKPAGVSSVLCAESSL